MSDQEFFKNALSNFTFEAASGGAIRHLADLGYSVKQIYERLDFPTPYEKVQKVVWNHLLDTGGILCNEPGSGAQRETYTYVKEYDKYGRTGFRRVAVADKRVESGKVPVCWSERHVDGKESFAAILEEKCAENGEENAYASCDFGLRSLKEPERFQEMLQVLDETLRDYILGLTWEQKLCYHRLNRNMRRIMVRLYENGGYHGSCYFIKTKERLDF